MPASVNKNGERARSTRKMQWALNSFKRTSNNQHRHILTAGQYSLIRREFSDATRGMKRGPMTDAHKANLSKSRKEGNIGKIIIPWNKGIPATATHKANNSAGNKGKIQQSGAPICLVE